jgi:hypothetical protein
MTAETIVHRLLPLLGRKKIIQLGIETKFSYIIWWHVSCSSLIVMWQAVRKSGPTDYRLPIIHRIDADLQLERIMLPRIFHKLVRANL